jgi:hypothetical protein
MASICSYQYDYPISVININCQSGPQKKTVKCYTAWSWFLITIYLFIYSSLYAIPILISSLIIKPTLSAWLSWIKLRLHLARNCLHFTLQKSYSEHLTWYLQLLHYTERTHQYGDTKKQWTYEKLLDVYKMNGGLWYKMTFDWRVWRHDSQCREWRDAVKSE